MIGIFDKVLSRKVTRKDFLKYGSLLLIGGLIGGLLKMFSNNKEDNNDYGNSVYGGGRK